MSLFLYLGRYLCVLENHSSAGVGLGNVEYWMRNFSIYNVGGVENIHNWWFELLTSFGITIFIMYIIFYIKLIMDFFKSLTHSTNSIDVSFYSALIGLLIAFVFGSVSSSSIISAEWIWIIFALLISLQSIVNKKRFFEGADKNNG